MPYRWHAFVQLSPTFARARLWVLRGARYLGRGEAWTKVAEGGTRSYLDFAPSCTSLAIGSPPGNLAALLGLLKATRAVQWVAATNEPPASAGLPPNTRSLAQVRVISAPNRASGTVVAVSSNGDLWALGP